MLQQLLELKGRKLHFVIGFVKDKDVDTVLQLFPKQAEYYFCQANIPRALPIEELKIKANKLGYLGNYFNTVTEALFAAKENQQPSDIIYVGGSNFIVAEII